MAKPEDKPTKPNKGKAERTATYWEAKGWTSATIPAGETDLDVSFDPATQDLNVKRQLHDAEGKMMTGHGHPKLTVEHTESGAVIALQQPSDTDLKVIYRVVEESEDEDENGEPAPAEPSQPPA